MPNSPNVDNIMHKSEDVFIDYITESDEQQALATDDDAAESMYVIGVFLKSGIVSRNGYYYPEEVVKKFVTQINENKDMPITMWTSHFPPDSILYTVGRVENAWYDEDTKTAWFKAKLANTTIGRDVQQLIKGGFVKGVSIRYIPVTYTEDEEMDALVIQDAILLGIDFAGMPSVPMARVHTYTYEEHMKTDADEQWEKFVEMVVHQTLDSVNKEGRRMSEAKDVEVKEQAASPDVVTVSIDDIKKEYEEEMAELKAAFELLGKEKAELEEKNKALEAEIETLNKVVEELKHERDAIEAFVFSNIKQTVLERLGEYKASKTFVEKVTRDIEKIPYPTEGTFEERMEAYKSELENVIESFKAIVDELRKQVTEEKLPKGGSVAVNNEASVITDVRARIKDILIKHEFVIDREGDNNG